MDEKSIKSSITNSKATQIATKFAVSYIRVSTKAQTKEEKSGIERQEKDYLNWLEKNQEYKNLDGFEVRDLGISGRGKNSKVGALSLFLKAAEQGKIPANTCLVVESMSRLTREAPREALKLINKIFDYGLTISFIQFGGDVFDGGDSQSGMWFQVMGGISAASMEWKDKSERQNGYQRKVAKQLAEGDFSSFKPRKKGTAGNLYPFWIYVDETTGTIRAFEKETKLVQRIFNMSETMGAGKIAKILKKEGVQSPLSGRNKYLSKDSITTCILKNRAVMGEKKKLDVVCYPFPAIITPEQFERVAAAKENRRLNRTFTAPTNKTVNLFQGVIRCGHCGGRMDVITRRRIVGTKKWAKGGEKIEVEMSHLQCHNSRNNYDCKITNTVPYKQTHNNIDNELEILNRIALFRWEDFLTDEKHEKEVEIHKDKRLRALDQKNRIKAKLENFKKAEMEYFAEGRAVPINLEKQQLEAAEQYKEAESKYERAKLDLQNLERKKSGKQAAKDIRDKINYFLDKDRIIEEKRSEFNLFLKEIGLAVQVLIPEKVSKARKYESPINFEVGIGIYEPKTNKYIGLDQRAEDAEVLGMNVKEVIKIQIEEKNKAT